MTLSCDECNCDLRNPAYAVQRAVYYLEKDRFAFTNLYYLICHEDFLSLSNNPSEMDRKIFLLTYTINGVCDEYGIIRDNVNIESLLDFQFIEYEDARLFIPDVTEELVIPQEYDWLEYRDGWYSGNWAKSIT